MAIYLVVSNRVQSHTSNTNSQKAILQDVETPAKQ